MWRWYCLSESNSKVDAVDSSALWQVTDGEIPRAKDDVKNRLAAARDELELKVHCLLVGEDPTGQSANHPLLELVDKLHVFTSWSSA